MIATATTTRPSRQDAAPLVIVSCDTHVGLWLVEGPRIHCPASSAHLSFRMIGLWA